MTNKPFKAHYYPALANSSSWHKTGFQSPADFHAHAPATSDPEYRRREDEGNEGKPGFELMAVYPSARRASSAERLGNRRFKMVSYRPCPGAPASTGTSEPGYPCLTTGLDSCITVSVAAISPDMTMAMGRNFHCHSENETWETLSQYSEYLRAHGLQSPIATISGGWGNKHKNSRLTRATQQEYGKRAVTQAIRRSVANAQRIKQELAQLGILLIVDHAGDNRPDDMTEQSNVGFEFLRTMDGTMEFKYRHDLPFDSEVEN